VKQGESEQHLSCCLAVQWSLREERVNTLGQRPLLILLYSNFHVSACPCTASGTIIYGHTVRDSRQYLIELLSLCKSAQVQLHIC